MNVIHSFFLSKNIDNLLGREYALYENPLLFFDLFYNSPTFLDVPPPSSFFFNLLKIERLYTLNGFYLKRRSCSMFFVEAARS